MTDDIYTMAHKLLKTSSPESQIYRLADALIKEHDHHIWFVNEVDKQVKRLIKHSVK